MVSRKRGLRVLLVDDDTAILEMMQFVLTDEGFEVLGAGGVAAAQRLITEDDWLPEVAVVDLLMEPEDGSQLARWLRDNYPAVRIVIYSAWAEAEAVQVLRREMQADAFVAKPGDMTELIAAIRAEAS